MAREGPMETDLPVIAKHIQDQSILQSLLHCVGVEGPVGADALAWALVLGIRRWPEDRRRVAWEGAAAFLAPLRCTSKDSG